MKMKTYTVHKLMGVFVRPYVIEESGNIVAGFADRFKADQFAKLLNQEFAQGVGAEEARRQSRPDDVT